MYTKHNYLNARFPRLGNHLNLDVLGLDLLMFFFLVTATERAVIGFELITQLSAVYIVLFITYIGIVSVFSSKNELFLLNTRFIIGCIIILLYYCTQCVYYTFYERARAYMDGRGGGQQL